MYHTFIMKSLENNENCKKEDIFENDNYLTNESYLTTFIVWVCFHPRKR